VTETDKPYAISQLQCAVVYRRAQQLLQQRQNKIATTERPALADN